VEEADGGPDATSSEYRPGRAYGDGQWLEAGTAEVQVRARFSSTMRWRLTVTGSSGATARSFSGRGASARPATSRVFVDPTPPPAGSSSGGFTSGAWRVSNVNAEQPSTSAPVFASYRWGRKGDLPVVGDWDGDGTQTLGVVRPSQARDSNHLLLRNGDGSVVDDWFGRSGDRYLVGDWDNLP
jgi:hypothetical protein